MDDKFAALLMRLEAVTTKLETMETAPPASTGAAAVAGACATGMVTG